MPSEDPLADPVLFEEFENFIRSRDFPCVGAKSALSRGQLKIVPCWSMENGWSDVLIHRELLQWAYDDEVSSDPEDPHFSLSFGGEAFFVVGMHPNASRPARRFRSPALVFNLHQQFEQLRAEGRYEKIRDTILNRYLALAGSVNPMLALHGESSEARQYSGRLTDTEWRCPFADKRNAEALGK